jgi:dTDP-4-amino-4,6-dideoxygalactose transaminase
VHWKIPLSDVQFRSDEKSAIMRVLEGGWLTMGAETSALEGEFANFIGAKHAIAVTNGTTALHLACIALGLSTGDEVILPSLTFVATAAAVLYAGATPVFADISGELDLNLSPESIKGQITERSRAIIVMHYGGYLCDLPQIMEVAHEYNLAIIEDAAHAPGAELNGRKAGTWGDIGCFSFFSNKNMVTGEGGMLVTNDDDLAEKLRLLRSHGMTSLSWDRHRGHAWSYDVVELGYNYRIDEIRAALGRVQLSQLEENNKHRRYLTEVYHRELRRIVPEIVIPFQRHPGVSSCHILPVLLPPGSNRTHFMENMKARGIQTSIHYPPIHRFKYYQDHDHVKYGPLPITEEISAREVTLPLFSDLQTNHVSLVVHSVRDSLRAKTVTTEGQGS